MPRGRPRNRAGRGSSVVVAPKATRNRGKAKGKKRGTNSRRTTAAASESTREKSHHRRPWEDSDSERERPDYYSDSSEYDSDGIAISPRKGRRGGDELEDEEEEDEIDEDDEDYGTNTSCRGPIPGTSMSTHSEIPVCPWIEIPPEELAPLVLPESSEDLLLEGGFLLDALEVYETCRNYYRFVRISPFHFEDFCAALVSEEQSNLLAEIHISLLKLALKDDEEEQITLSVQDTNNSVNIIFQLLEPMTYAEVLRQYVESDPHRFPSEVLTALSGNYPFVDVKRRLTVLLWLCDRFLHSIEYRNIIKNEGKFVSDEHCRECGKPGDVLLCDGCEACYHLECARLDAIPDGQWLCQICKLHVVHGVTDCDTSSSHRSQRPSLRKFPLGYDRHGRRYWFAVRRIFVQDDSDGSVTYYSTLPQLHGLLNMLAVGDLEKHLAAAVMDLLPEIAAQMRISIELTNAHALFVKPKPNTYFDSDNLKRMAEIVSRPLPGTCRQADDKDIIVYTESGKAIEVSKTLLLSKVEELLGFDWDKLEDFTWSAGLSAEKIMERRFSRAGEETVSGAGVREDANGSKVQTAKLGFRFGENNSFRSYKNLYSTNDYAKSPYLRAKERDKKKYLCNRFSLADEGEFQWTLPKGRDLFGASSLVCQIIQLSLLKMAQKIPPPLMHRLWKKDGLESFKKGVTTVSNVKLLRDLLLRFECGIRKPVMASVFWASLGHTRLMRTTVEDRDSKQRLDLKRKKMDRELMIADVEDEDSDVVWVKYTKLKGTPKHSLWRVKDEQYRVNGRGGLGGWLWVSHILRRDIRPLPEKPPLGITADTPVAQLTTTAAKRAKRLDGIVKKLTSWRQAQIEDLMEAAGHEPNAECYSRSCRSGVTLFAVDENHPKGMARLKCYSCDCRKLLSARFEVTSAAVQASDPNTKEQKKQKGVLGEDIPFPLPVPFDFRVRRSGLQSLLVLPQKALRRLARQGGTSVNFAAPGFHRIAKSNSQVWNYPCQRPLFDHCWRYVTLRAGSYHAVALQLRILFACIRWGDMRRDEDDDMYVTVHHPDHDEVRTVVGHKEWPPDGTYEQYKLKLQLIPLDDPNDSREETGESELAYRPGRSLDSARSSRRRKAAAKPKSDGGKMVKAQVTEKWIDGVELKLWEICNYWRALENIARRQTMAPPHGVPTKYTSPRAAAVNGTELSPAIYGRSSTPRRRPVPKRLEDFDYECEEEPEPEEPQRKVLKRAPPSESPLEARPRVVDRSGSSDENGRLKKVEVRKEAGQLRGGGKFTVMQQSGGAGMRRVVLCPSDPPQIARTMEASRHHSRSPIDEPPLIPRYDSSAGGGEVSGTPQRIVTRPVPQHQQRILYTAAPSTPQGASVRPLGNKVLMIRRADGSTQFLRPISHSSSKDEQGATHTVITTAQVGGSTMSEGRALGVGTVQRVTPVLQQQRQHANGSLDDHAGMAHTQPCRVIPSFRERPAYLSGQPTRFARTVVASSSPASSQPSSSSVYVSPSVRGIRVQPTPMRTNVVITEKDPFMKRMAAEKAISGGVPSLYASTSSSSGVRRRTGGDTYAGYYGEKSNDRINVEEYQMLAEQGYRPPGRPPGRLASTFGYGPRVNQQRTAVISQGAGRGGITARYHTGATTVIGADFRPVTKFESVPHNQSTSYQSPAMVGTKITLSSVGDAVGGPIRNVTSLKEYCQKKGIPFKGERLSRPALRPVRFDFESNEEEERAIAEAIAKEEELMRLEEERDRISRGLAAECSSDLKRFDEQIRRNELALRHDSEVVRMHAAMPPSSTASAPTFHSEPPSNLIVKKTDSPDTVVFKELLSELITTVCKWDRHYGWLKALQRKAKGKRDDRRPPKARKTVVRHVEVELGERIDRLKKEINKRQVKLVMRAEAEVGMCAPWRRPRGRPNRTAARRMYGSQSPKAQFIGAPVDPSEISLGGEVHVYPDSKPVKEEEKEEPENVAPAQPEVSSFIEKQEMREATPEAADTKSAISASKLGDAQSTPSPYLRREDRKRRKRKRDDSSSDDGRRQLGTSRGRSKKEAAGQERDARPSVGPSTSAAAAPAVPSRPGRSGMPSSSQRAPLPEIDPTQNHCKCNQPYNPKKFYVGCDLCSRWFHGKCVGLTEKKSKKISNWTCDDCLKEKKKSDQELYCLCRTPYDDSRFYVGCDGCEGWFHPQCVHITQAEAEKMAEYLCPNCKANTQSGYESTTSVASSVASALRRADYPLLWNILEALTEQRTSWPFREKVDKTNFPDYYKVIKKPMDLSVVRSKMERLEYERLKDFSADITQIFENARTYNPKDSAIYQCAEILEKRFREQLTVAKEQIEARKREYNRVSESHTVESLDIDTDQLIGTLSEDVNLTDEVDISIFDDVL